MLAGKKGRRNIDLAVHIKHAGAHWRGSRGSGNTAESKSLHIHARTQTHKRRGGHSREGWLCSPRGYENKLFRVDIITNMETRSAFLKHTMKIGIKAHSTVFLSRDFLGFFVLNPILQALRNEIMESLVYVLFLANFQSHLLKLFFRDHIFVQTIEANR